MNRKAFLPALFILLTAALSHAQELRDCKVIGVSDGDTPGPERRRAGKAPRRRVADALICALATRHDGVLTRNPEGFRRFDPKIRVVRP